MTPGKRNNPIYTLFGTVPGDYEVISLACSGLLALVELNWQISVLGRDSVRLEPALLPPVFG